MRLFVPEPLKKTSKTSLKCFDYDIFTLNQALCNLQHTIMLRIITVL